MPTPIRPRRMLKALAHALILALAAGAVTTSGQAQSTGPDGLMAWPDLLERPPAAPPTTISDGEESLQVVGLWRRDGAGPDPVAMVAHGGCWQTDIADRTIMNWIAEGLRRGGIAVWNIDY